LSTADRILFFIKTKGPASTATLAQAFDMTPEAARQQVQKLAAEFSQRLGYAAGSAG